MSKTNSKTLSQKYVEIAIKGLQEKKAENIICIDLKEIDNSICDFFVIASGTSNTHVNALAESVKEEIKKTLKDNPWHGEGFGNAEWILLDYVNVVIHIFLEDARTFYNLEGLWGDAKITKVKRA